VATVVLALFMVIFMELFGGIIVDDFELVQEWGVFEFDCDCVRFVYFFFVFVCYVLLF